MSGGRDMKKVKERVLSCPRCKIDMVEEQRMEAFLDECKQCGGLFFDQGEMFAALGAKADNSYWDRDGVASPMKDGHVKCPRCRAEMHLQDISHEGTHVEIDRCGECGGIYLDKGEAEKIIAIGEKLHVTVLAEKAAAQAELDKMGDVDFSPPGLISRFLGLFKKKK